jgi:pentatricopeptide repeat protein
MTDAIVPGHQSLYYWQFEDISERQALVTFRVPGDVDADSIRVDFTTGDASALVCRLGDELPFIAGWAFAAISTHCRSQTDDLLALTFTKAQPGQWSLLIAEPLPGTLPVIDPFSAFQLALLRTHAVESGELRPDCIGSVQQDIDVLLHIALSSRFPPALTFKAALLMQAKRHTEANRLLEIAAVDYDDTDLMNKLGLSAFHEGDNRSAARWFRMSAERGNVDAWIFLGEIYSPFEGEPSDLKDGACAMEAFATVLQRHENHPYACFGMAKLLLNGCGVEKDVARAKELYIRAKENGLSPDTGGIVFQGKDLAEWVPEEGEANLAPEEGGRNWVPVIISGAVAAVVGGLALFRFLRGRKPRVDDE